MGESAALRVIRKIADGHRDKHASDRELLTRFAEKRDVIRRMAREALEEDERGKTLPLDDLL